MTETGSIDARFIRFRAWNGRRMRAQAQGDGHFLISLGVELRWRRLPYIKFRSDADEFWTALILDGQFVLKPAKGEPIILRSHSLRYRGWAEAPGFDRWISHWSPETNLFEHTLLSVEQALAIPPIRDSAASGQHLYD